MAPHFPMCLKWIISVLFLYIGKNQFRHYREEYYHGFLHLIPNQVIELFLRTIYRLAMTETINKLSLPETKNLSLKSFKTTQHFILKIFQQKFIIYDLVIQIDRFTLSNNIMRKLIWISSHRAKYFQYLLWYQIFSSISSYCLVYIKFNILNSVTPNGSKKFETLIHEKNYIYFT